ncbi:hypothetical protein B566_EDAN005491 [Ephemera danica]|nr:hypothetical protein B566_EDAN005491 [Ephemera danica]
MVSRLCRDTGKLQHMAVNACLAPVCSLHGLAVTTVEGIGSTRSTLHPVQERLALSHGSQCGFCTPGIVMSMYALLRSSPSPSLVQLEETFQGNLCRCTGYRPIVEAFRSFVEDWETERGTSSQPSCNGVNGKNGCCSKGKENGCCMENGANGQGYNVVREVTDQLVSKMKFTPYDASQEAIFPSELQISDALDTQQLVFRGERVTWHRPLDLTELLELKARHPDARLVMGNTEVGLEMKFKQCVYPVLIQPSLVRELSEVRIVLGQGVTFGAAVTLSEVETQLRQQVEQQPRHVTRVFSAVLDMLHWFAGKQIRNDAINQNAFIENPHSKMWQRNGDVTSGLERSEYSIEGEVHVGGQEHFYLETQCARAIPGREDDEIHILSATQVPAEVQKHVALMLGVPQNRVVCKTRRIGGGFGGKETKSFLVALPVALAAKRLRRPVRCMLDRYEDMLLTGGRNPFLGRYRVGFSPDGQIRALDINVFGNAGCSLDISGAVVDRSLFNATNSYNITDISTRGYVCQTNLPSNTSLRGFGSPQMTVVIESIIEDVASELCMDPALVRARNFYNEGDVTHYGQKLVDCTLQRCWDECKVNSDYTSRKKIVQLFNKEHRWRKRGISLVPLTYGIGFEVAFMNQAGALVHIYTDGSILLMHGGVASRALGVPEIDIHIPETSTKNVPNAISTAASVSSDLNGMAIVAACKTLLDRLKPYREANPEGAWKDWVNAAYFDRVSLSTTGFYKTTGVYMDFDLGKGNPFDYFSYGVACSEVEIDCLTGDHQILRTDIVMDLGESLNPAIDVGQVEGAFLQGVGLLTTEELLYSPEGVMLTRGPSTYKIPGFSDAPARFNVTLLRGSSNPRAVYSSKAIGEPPLLLATSVFCAIKGAIAAAREDAGLSGRFRLDSPATSARIRVACVDQFMEKGLVHRATEVTSHFNQVSSDEHNARQQCIIFKHSRLLRQRKQIDLCGTKLGCGEGGCGACTVMVSRLNRDIGKLQHMAVNACLAPVCSLHGLAVTTVEGIGSTRSTLHPVQERLALSHGSQCGFCTPGIVMSMYALLRSSPSPSLVQLEETFQGNLCRCTGYRPIVEAFRSFVEDWETERGTTSSQTSCIGVNGANGCCREGKENGCCKENSTSSEDYDGVREITDQLVNKMKFTPYDASQEAIFPSELQISDALDTQQLVFRGEMVTWHRPLDLTELLELKAKHPDARLVMGNTEVGLEMKFKQCVYPVLIQPSLVRELSEVRIVLGQGVTFGAAVTLSEVETQLRQQVEQQPRHVTRVFSAVLDMLHWFAGKQIRNVGTLGGNIMTSSPISDLNPIFLAANCELKAQSKLDGVRAVCMDHEFFTSYRRNALKPHEVLLSISIPYSSEHQYFAAFKQAKRREDDIAIVNAAFNVHLRPGSDVETLQLALDSLASEMTLDPGAPGGVVRYRRSLTLGFFFKFFLMVQQERGVSLQARDVSATSPYHSALPAGSQYFEKVPDGQASHDLVGRPIPHLAGMKHTTGEAVYCDDMPCASDELFLALVTSTRAHARLLSVDASQALALSGVEAFFSAKDLDPDRNRYGLFFQDEEVLAQGQIIGAVVAKSREIAQRAAKLVHIEYEDLKPLILSIEDAIREESFFKLPYEHILTRGDATNRLEQSEVCLEGEVRMGGQEHFYLETNCTRAVPSREDEEMTIFCATQSPTSLQGNIAKILGVPHNRVRCHVRRLGGGFGGKESRFMLVAAPVALAAQRLRRPVRCMLDRDEDMMITGGRNPYLGRYKVMNRALYIVTNSYDINDLFLRGYVCRTNLPSNTAMRGFGSPQALFIGEMIVEDVAAELGMDPALVRARNLLKEGDVTCFGQKLVNCTLRRCWDECEANSDYATRKELVQQFNKEHRWKKRGISMTPLTFGCGFDHPFPNQAGALIHIYTDGSVLLTHGGVEMGQGLHTKIAQVASRALGVPEVDVHITETRTDTVPNTIDTAASVSSDLNGMAIIDACNKLLNRLKPYREANPKGEWKDWVKAAHYDRVSLSATGFYKLPLGGYDWMTSTGTGVFNYYSFGVACSEVEIDCLTGDHQILRTDIVMDLGESLNPAIDVGQVEGAFLQGVGLLTTEELLYSPEGVMLTRGPSTYKIPGFSDAPARFNVTLLRGSSNPRAVYSSKAVGEPPLLLATSVFCAIKGAIAAAREDAGLSGRFRLDSPATSACIRLACADQFMEKV